MTMNQSGTPVEILLVEDNPGDQELTREAFKEGRISNTLHIVDDGEQAMQFLRDQSAVLAPSSPGETSETADGGKTPENSETSPSPEALAVLCQMLLSSNEFLYVD